jgi:hypothetical protein
LTATGLRILLSRLAVDRLDAMPAATERRVMARLYELAADPEDDRLSCSLKGALDLRLSRAEDVRIFFTADAAERTLYVVALRRLDPRR